MKRNVLIVLSALFVVIAIMVGTVTWQARSFLTTPPQSPGHEVTIDVAPGSTFDQVTAQLKAQGLITNVKKFRMLGRWRDQVGKIKTGEFSLHTSWTPGQILDTLTQGKNVLHRLAIPEGLTWWQIGERVQRAGLGSFESFKAAVHDPELLKTYNIPADTAEGFLFPSTYHVPKPRSNNARPVVRTMLSTFWQQAGNKLWTDSKPTPKELMRIVTLASMVEKETGVASERERIAGVYSNRLKRRMLMQCDPTIIYGLGEAFDGNLTRAHLKDKTNPYNTYRHPGLPPGPICSPGLHALQSAMIPEKSSYLYFVAKGDRTHYFSKSLKEHNNAVQKYQLRRRRRQ